MSIRPIALVADPKEAAEAEGVTILRAIGGERLILLDPFLLLDHLVVAPSSQPELGFPRHPHRGIETLTYVVDGWVHHRDSLGNDSRVGAGGAQWMRAGRGIFHEEFLRAGEQGSEALQVWFNLPATEKLTPATYQAVGADQLPVVALPGGATVTVLAGEHAGATGPLTETGIGVTYLALTLPPGSTATIPAPRTRTAFAYVYRGRVACGATEVSSGRLAIFADAPIESPENDELALENPGTTEARCIVLLADPLREPIFQYRSSVMNTASQIGEAIADLERGTFA